MSATSVQVLLPSFGLGQEQHGPARLLWTRSGTTGTNNRYSFGLGQEQLGQGLHVSFGLGQEQQVQTTGTPLD